MAITSRVITALEIMTKDGDGASKNWNMRTETWSGTAMTIIIIIITTEEKKLEIITSF
jgi:hypothetical protein